ncbi:MAG TPA: PASTA domain-containing protein [Edaphobacter sp.]|jgi:beta-lactam-binding protein with PASTA domain|nr:PASTA domain-containing protein [Edaphobacter sp.]
MKISRINRFFNIVLGALAMFAVALLSAFITMRLAIHGREVKVPNLTGLTLSDASKQTRSLGLILTLENRFYSPNTPPGRILAQSPAPGVTVRRQWAVRVTESLGAQQVAIPDVLGQSERTASINIRRLGLELGAVAHIAAPGEPGVVIAQTPGPNAAGVDRPRVSLLLSEPEETESPQAVVMPSLAGLTLAGAAARAAAAGLRIVSAEDLNLPAPNTAATPAPPSTANTPAASTPPATLPSPSPATAAPSAPAAQAISIGTVIAQTPPAGRRVVKGDAVHITLTN